MFRKRHFVTTLRRFSWSTEKRLLRASLGLPAVCRDWLKRSENSCSDVNHWSAKIVTHTHGTHFGTESANQFLVISYTDTCYPRVFLLHYGFNAWWIGKHALQHAPRTAMCEGNLLQTCRWRVFCLSTWRDTSWHEMRWHDMTWHAGRDMTFNDVTRR